MKNLENVLVKELTKNADITLCNGDITFHAKKVGMKVVNGQKMVVVEWTQDFHHHDGLPALPFKGIVGFYFKGNNNMRVVNFDYKKNKGKNFYIVSAADEDEINDIAGAVVKHIAGKVNCFSRYDRHNPNTFDVIYI